MADPADPLLGLRYVGIGALPEAGDAADRRLKAGLDREMRGKVPGHHWWRRRRIRIAGLAVPPVAVLALAATAAAATTAAIVTITATTLFQHDPQGVRFNGAIETVLPSTVRVLSTVDLPDYGAVQVWGATTKPGGFCFALKLPDGAWGGLHASQNAQDGWTGGSLPGCFQTRQQAILRQPQVQPGQQASASTGQVLIPEALEEWDNEIVSRIGTEYSLYIGYVEAQGTATTVRDPDTGASAKVMPDGYYVLAERARRARVQSDGGDLQVLDAAGQPLKPDYTWGAMLPRHLTGPSQG